MRTILRHSIGIAALLGWSLACSAQTVALSPQATTATDSAMAETVARRVEREMSKNGIVGLALAVSRGEKIVHAAAFGFEDRESEVEVSDQTMFRWASVSKPVTAVVAMQLANEGKLDLDADIRTLVPEFPEKPQAITARQLLCHQGGIVHYGNGSVIKTERTYSNEHPYQSVVLAMDMFKDSPLVNEPGAKNSYSTHGYILLSAVAERAAARKSTGADGVITWSGPSFAELVRSRISEPLGMTSMQPDYQWVEIPHRAVGYREGKKREIVVSTDTDVSWKLGGGGFISTATDMARFGGGMLGSRLVDAETRNKMWSEQVTREGEATGYGLGFVVQTQDGQVRASHSGGQEKASTFLLIDPAAAGGDGLAVAVMCNTEERRLGKLASDLVEIMDEFLSKAEEKK